MTKTDKVKSIYQRFFCPQPITPNVSYQIYTTVKEYGEDLVLDTMRYIYRRGDTSVSFAYIQKAVERNATSKKAQKRLKQGFAYFVNGTSPFAKQPNTDNVREVIACNQRMFSIKGFLNGKARGMVGDDIVAIIANWIKNGGEKPVKEIEALKEAACSLADDDCEGER